MGWLVLGRKVGEEITIRVPGMEKEIRLMFMSCDHGRCRIGIDAPVDVQVHRAELTEGQRHDPRGDD